MKTTEHGIVESGDVENTHHMRLMTLLDELVRDKGLKAAARLLELDQRTVEQSMRTGRLSRRVRQAVGRALQEGVGSAAAKQRERNDSLEERLSEVEAKVESQAKSHDELGKELRRRMAAVEGAVQGLRRDDGRGTGAGHAGAGPSQADAEKPVEPAQGEKPPKKPRARREYPTLVTREPAEDDADVFGEAWPLIARWRELKDAHPNDGKGFEWLARREKLLTVELQLLEHHGMTLPPEKQPLHGLDRSGQTSWRRTALSGTRRARKRAELLRKVLTLGRWRGDSDLA